MSKHWETQHRIRLPSFYGSHNGASDRLGRQRFGDNPQPPGPRKNSALEQAGGDMARKDQRRAHFWRCVSDVSAGLAQRLTYNLARYAGRREKRQLRPLKHSNQLQVRLSQHVLLIWAQAIRPITLEMFTMCPLEARIMAGRNSCTTQNWARVLTPNVLRTSASDRSSRSFPLTTPALLTTMVGSPTSRLSFSAALRTASRFETSQTYVSMPGFSWELPLTHHQSCSPARAVRRR